MVEFVAGSLALMQLLHGKMKGVEGIHTSFGVAASQHMD